MTEVVLISMAIGAVLALVVSWPIWMWRMDRQHKQDLKWVGDLLDRQTRELDDGQ